MADILLVEDDADVRFIMQHVLVGVGHRVDGAQNVREALRSLQHNVYDLVVTDGVLPDGTGLDVADEVAQKGTRTIIVTGYGSSSEAPVIQPGPMYRATPFRGQQTGSNGRQCGRQSDGPLDQLCDPGGFSPWVTRLVATKLV